MLDQSSEKLKPSHTPPLARASFMTLRERLAQYLDSEHVTVVTRHERPCALLVPLRDQHAFDAGARKHGLRAARKAFLSALKTLA